MKYETIIEQMTLEEKASLCSGKNFWNTKPIERLGVPSMMLTDGPHGMRKQGGKEDHLGLHASIPATCYPAAASLANSWDEALIEEMGRYLGLEAKSEGVGVLLGPGVNIKRSPLCGRSFEYFSEDPLLAGRCGAALIRGIQQNGVSACVKHFAANSQEHLRMTSDSVMDERTLREIYLPAFEMAVKDGGVKSLMTSYNQLNGEFCNENSHLLQDILHDEWGFDGLVVTDWGGNNDRVAGLVAGCHLEMPSTKGETDRHIVNAVREGKIKESLLDERVNTLLEIIFLTNSALKNKISYDQAKHHAFARKIANECAVLLKNDEKLLPIDSGKTVAVIGDFAETARYQGAGSSKINPTMLDNGLAEMKSSGINVIGYEAGFLRHGGKNDKLLQRACALAKQADVAVLWLGLDEGGEAEGIDRTTLSLPENQLTLLKAVQAVNTNIVVVLSCGGVVTMEWEPLCKAILHGYLGGQAGAGAIADILCGKVNPSGKLAETIPHALADIAASSYFPGTEATAEYRESIFVGYRYFDTAKKDVKYPFGFGLSYSTFAYSDISVQNNQVRFFIENTGTSNGAEVAQVYLSLQSPAVFRAEQQLCGFARVFLKAGEKQEVIIPLQARAFSYWNVKTNAWEIEGGTYEVRVGASSRDIRLAATVEHTGTAAKNPYTNKALAPYFSGAVDRVPDEAFAALLGHDIPPTLWDRNAPLHFNSTLAQGAYLKNGLGKLLYNTICLVRNLFFLFGKKELGNNVMFVMNLPYRGVSHMSGLVSDEQMMALIKVINHEKGGWREFFKARKIGK